MNCLLSLLLLACFLAQIFADIQIIIPCNIVCPPGEERTTNPCGCHQSGSLAASSRDQATNDAADRTLKTIHAQVMPPKKTNLRIQ